MSNALRLIGQRLPGTAGILRGMGFLVGEVTAAELATIPCDETRRGEMRRVEGEAGAADQFVICEKDAAEAYAWTTVTPLATPYSDEMARDAIAAALVAGNNIDITVDDGADTITVAVEALTTADLSDFETAGDARWVNVGGDTMTGDLVIDDATLALRSTSGAVVADIERYANDTFGLQLRLFKSRHTTLGAHTIVNSGDSLGHVVFAGSDGASPRAAAQISAQVDGTPGASDMPGRLIFFTTPDGSATPSERMRISSTGLVSIPSGGSFSVGGGTALTAILRGTTTWDPGSVSAATPVSTTVTVTGAAAGNPVAVGLSTLTTQDLQLTGTVSAANTVTVTLSHADTVGSVDLGSGTLSAVVFQF